MNNIKMEPYIQLINTDFDPEKQQFVDRIRFDGYDFSVVVSKQKIEDAYTALDYLWYTPKVGGGNPNIANMNYWEFHFYDDKGRICTIEKNGEYIYFILPLYNIFRTDVSSGIAYLRIFHDTVKHLVDVIHPPINAAQIVGEDC